MEHKKLTQDQFWMLVEKLDWVNLSKKVKIDFCNEKLISYIKIKENTLDFFYNHLADFHEYFEFFREPLENLMKEQFKKAKHSKVGDDGMSDVVCHIIGLGKEEYFKHLQNYDLILEKIENSDYRENFSYILPRRDDKNWFNPEFYQLKSKKMIEEINERYLRIPDPSLLEILTYLQAVQKRDLREISAFYRRNTSGDFKALRDSYSNLLPNVFELLNNFYLCFIKYKKESNFEI